MHIKKIGIVLPSMPGYSETFFKNKINGLLENQYKVVILTQGNPKLLQSENKNLRISYGPNVSGNFFYSFYNIIYALIGLIVFSPIAVLNYWRLEKLNGSSLTQILKRLIINSHILREKLDWLHFGFTTMGIDRELVGKAIGAKVAVSFRGYDISIFPLKNPDCYKLLWGNLDKVHTISDDLLNEAYLLGMPKQIEVVKITPAINATYFQNSRKSYFRGQTVRMLTVGRLHWKKGISYVLEAISKVKKAGYTIEYTIVGSGSEYESLVYNVYQLGLINEVNFIGKKEQSEIPNLMSSHDMYIQYSVQEGFCNAVLEAQAAGMLCIVSDAEGLSENVLDEITGWVVPKREPHLLAEQIIKTINTELAILNNIRDTAIERVNKEFNLELQKAAFDHFYSI